MEHHETTAGHGRIEERKIEVLPAGSVRFAGVKQWGRITRTRTNKKTGKTTHEEVHFISSLGLSQATPAELLAYNRSHWAIENNLHRNKDNLLGEDASTVRTKNAPQTLSAIRNLALNLLTKINKSPKLAREFAQYNINDVLQLIT